MDLYEIRNTTKKLLREGTPTSVEYEKALPLCKELFDAFPETHEKQNAINKVACLLKSGGKFVLSIDKSQGDFIDMGTRKITIFPDSPTEIKDCILNADLDLVECFDTELAHIFVAKKVI